MLAGRKLLLADDSITIQKVVELTFADEGVSVVCANNGREAIDMLGEFTPDVVLADVFMPQVNGYEVCEYIKRNERLKHIPVMLLVGSFEPFDEGEARRVGANDTLTKPFQSIRRLIDKVGQLVSGRSPEEQIPTAELPKPESAVEPPVEKLSTAELEITTADTKPLPPELKHVVDGATAQASLQPTSAVAPEMPRAAEPEEVELAAAPQFDQTMGIGESMVTGETGEAGESELMETRSEVTVPYEGGGDVLLELGDIQTASALDEDFVLDIDLDEAPEASPEPAFASASFLSRQRFSSPGAGAATFTSDRPAISSDPMAVTQEFQHSFEEMSAAVEEPLGAAVEEPMGVAVEEPAALTFSDVHVMEAPAVERVTAELVANPESAAPASDAVSATEVSLQQLSPEMIDAIAKRVIEQMSIPVIQEIAWEVVPQLAELLIKRQLEEKNS